MALIGLRRRHALCKICISFDDDVLNDITIDLITNRIGSQEVIDKYNPFLLEEMPRLNTGNLGSHKRHCDPALIAEEVLARRGEAVTKGDHAAVLYAERFKERIDQNVVLNSLYQNRINNVQFLREMMNEKITDYRDVKLFKDPISRTKKNIIEKELRGFISQVDAMEKNLQSTILESQRVSKGPGNTYINNQTNVTFATGLKNFMGEFIPYVLYQVFPDDIEKGKAVIARLSSILDRHLSSAMLDPDKQVPARMQVM